MSICTTSSLSIYLVVFSTNILFSPYRYINRSSIVSNIAVWKFILWYKWFYRNNKFDNYVLSTKRLDCPLLWSFFCFVFCIYFLSSLHQNLSIKRQKNVTPGFDLTSRNSWYTTRFGIFTTGSLFCHDPFHVNIKK